MLRRFLATETDERSEHSAAWLGVSGQLTQRTVRLLSGQVLPVVEVANKRGLVACNTEALVSASLGAAQLGSDDETEASLRRSIDSFLQKIYYDLHNRGRTSQDRALNCSATHLSQIASAFSIAVTDGLEFETIEASKSAFCRIESDCWDIKLRFFDPENDQRGKKIFYFTVDVADWIPVSIGGVKTWSVL